MRWHRRSQAQDDPTGEESPDHAQSSETDRADAPSDRRIDPDTGEILPARQGTEESSGAARHADAGSTTVLGERAIPSVNRERSIHSRISGALALATIVLLGGGFLAWYYGTQYARSHDAEEAARKAAVVRAGGEMKVPPLGRVAPPGPPSDMPVLATAGTVPAMPTTAPPPNAGGPPPKTPEQLALERQLGAPVLRKSQASVHQPLSVPTATAAPSHVGQPVMPSVAQILGAMHGTSAPSENGNLKPTPTAAVSAQVLPSQRLLLPKGAFIDCTLETAIDSTYEGMTTCIGASDIYGADGKVVLLERGTKYVGEQRGSPHQGQGRVFVLWNEARTPKGVVVQLASPGTDELGRNGLPGFVDTHFWARFGAAILISVVDGTMQAIVARQQGGTNVGGGVVIGAQGRDVMTEVLRNTIAIPPTVIKNQGERIQILVARDVDFRSVYALRAEPGTP